ncbi:hypothetical protein [Flavobacterium lindanitolerans]|uniref:hypothetical protein n=1 Tax=Flavobacterium lindanitolerans TaxID=428988 RepID=UPI0027B8A476|nr:hypothetical protein [Flavobacterium lindanitolerans]MDQ7960899.1 hypothetical protein [Flavobacterium lindanitolerans]
MTLGMASELTIYSIYKINGQERYFLLRTIRPGFLNASQEEEGAADAEEKYKREWMLDRISKDFGNISLILIGEIQGYPVGDALYSARGNTKMEIYYAKTQFGHPWIILGDAISEEAFLCEVEADEDFQSMELQGQPVKITVTYLTENDFPDPVKIT